MKLNQKVISTLPACYKKKGLRTWRSEPTPAARLAPGVSEAKPWGAKRLLCISTVEQDRTPAPADCSKKQESFCPGSISCSRTDVFYTTVYYTATTV